MESERPSTPPHAPAPKAMDVTPEQVRRMEEARLRSKALQAQRVAAAAAGSSSGESAASNRRTVSYATPTAGQKRPYSAISSQNAETNRDARTKASSSSNGMASAGPDIGIRPARNFQKFVEYDFSKMTDTKGGFITAEDDPHNKALHAADPNDAKPAHMTVQEWERQQIQRRLRETRSGPYEPGLSVLSSTREMKKCRECSSPEIDWTWDEVLSCQICATCKEKYPEKYSLLTKSEAKEDYLLTDPELRDTSLLPHLEKPNPHKSTWHNMMLYVRYQVEAFAFSAQKWGSPEALDAEFERRQKEGKERKEKKFRSKLNELKKRTRVEAYKRARGGGGGEFGDEIGKGKHEHEWGRAVEDVETGMMRRRCEGCGMEVEEMEF